MALFQDIPLSSFTGLDSVTTHPASDVVIDWSYGAATVYWESQSSVTYPWVKVDLLDTYHITRVLMAEPTGGGDFINNIRLDYSLDNDRWSRYYIDGEEVTDEVIVTSGSRVLFPE